MTGICVENCKLLLMKSVEYGRYETEVEVDFYKGKTVDIGDQVRNIDGNDFVELVVRDYRQDWADEFYWIKKCDRDKFFKRAPEETVQCNILPTMNEMNAFLKGIETDKIVSSGVDSTGCWVYYKTFVEKSWEE